MFERLQNKWGVGGGRLALILLTFAIGGSATGFVGKKIMNVLPVSQDWLWAIIYILLVTIIWPIAVLLVSIPFGQYHFFRNYITKLGRKMGIGKSRTRVQIAIFASGTGSNAKKIIEHFSKGTASQVGQVSLIVCNKPGAGVLNIARDSNIPVLILEKDKFHNGNGYVDELKERRINLLVLAGFLWKIPDSLIAAFPHAIVNIHPALLPKFGGRGMYGHHVHQSVIDSREKRSGITIHYVDGHYDNGDIIFQAQCEVENQETAESLAKKIQVLEHEYFPREIEKLATTLRSANGS